MEPDWKVRSWFDARFFKEEVKEAIVLPDVNPSGLIPNGAVVVLKPDWIERYAFPRIMTDIGCAMSFGEVSASVPQDMRKAWNELFFRLSRSSDRAILGSGNHFIDGCRDNHGALVIVVHVGSRATQAELQKFNFAADYQRYIDRAKANHEEIWAEIKAVFGSGGMCHWLAHDTAEEIDEAMIVRKGVVRAEPGDPILIASSFDDVLTVGRARPNIHDLLHSMSHGTGRRQSRGDAKTVTVDTDALRRRIIIPDALESHRWVLEAPVHYRSSKEIMELVAPYCEISNYLQPIAFMGQF